MVFVLYVIMYPQMEDETSHKMKGCGKMDLLPLSCSTLQKIPQDSYMLIDIRPRAEYNSKHIISSVNMHCSPLLFRRFERGNKPIDNLLLSEEVRHKLQKDPSRIIVLYDQDSKHDSVGKDVRQMGIILRRWKKNRSLFYLEGGIKTFAEEYHQYCESTPLSLPTANSKLDFRDPTDQALFSPLEHEPVLLLSHLFIGSAQHASNKEVLQRLGITAILNVSKNCRNNFEDQFTYKNIPVDDNFSEDIGKYFAEASSFIECVREKSGKVLVHCRAGISRSATICLAYLISRYRISLDEAYEFIKKKKSFISPNFGFLGQLLSLESETNIKCDENRTEVMQTPILSATKRIAQSPRSPLVPSSAENSSVDRTHVFTYPQVTTGSCSPAAFCGSNNGTSSSKLLSTPT